MNEFYYCWRKRSESLKERLKYAASITALELEGGVADPSNVWVKLIFLRDHFTLGFGNSSSRIIIEPSLPLKWEAKNFAVIFLHL